jgi:hypothetical protein
MLSSMSPSDLKSNNTNFGMAADLDSNKSTRFSPTVPVTGTGGPGYGICNNVPFDTSASVALTIKQHDGKGNPALLQRINRTVDTTTNSSFNNLYGASRIMTADQLNSEYKPDYTVSTDGKFMIWYDFAVINLKYIVDAIAKIGLVKKAELKLKMYINTGAVAVKVVDPALATVGYTTFNTTFANTCPLTVNLLPVTAANSGRTLQSIGGNAPLSYKSYQSTHNINAEASNTTQPNNPVSFGLQGATSTLVSKVTGILRTTGTGTFVFNFGCDQGNPNGTATLRAGAYLEIYEIN